jgi:hypothetical protein
VAGKGGPPPNHRKSRSSGWKLPVAGKGGPPPKRCRIPVSSPPLGSASGSPGDASPGYKATPDKSGSKPRLRGVAM